MQEAPLVDRGGRRLGIVEIALHHAVAADEQLARGAALELLPLRVGDDDFEAGHGAPSRRGDRLRVVVGPAPGARPGLGEPVAGEDGAERKRGAHLLDQRDRDVGRPGDRHPQGVEIEPIALGMVEDRAVDRGGAGQHRDPLRLHQGQYGGHVDTGTGTMVAPWSRLASHPALYPNMWKNGLTIR